MYMVLLLHYFLPTPVSFLVSIGLDEVHPSRRASPGIHPALGALSARRQSEKGVNEGVTVC